AHQKPNYNLRARRPEPAPSTRTADDDAIGKFLAERGATLVMAPEQVAVFLRDSGYDVVIREIGAQGKRGAPAIYTRKPIIAGVEATMAEMYAIANGLRARAGLAAISPPTTPQPQEKRVGAD